MQANSPQRQPINSAKYLAISFAVLIAVGTLLFSLPAASQGERMSILDALFTATSAVCVTGLTVITPVTQLTRFGQVVLISLIQVGGLGFLAFSTLLFMIIGKKLTLKNRLLLRESLNTDQLSGLLGLIKWVFALTAGVELIGAALLSIRFIPQYGLSEGIFMSVFHSISAFCNAGFDLLGSDSLTGVNHDSLILFTLMLIITCGSLGFTVMTDVIENRRFSRLSVHSKLVLVLTGILIFSGALFTALLEWNNPDTLGGMNSIWDRITNSLFQSVTLRTAGFAAVDQSALNQSTKFLNCIYMFIGAAPASTGGGVKLTTFVSLLLLVFSIAQGREQTVVFKHTISRKTLERAACILLIALGVVFIDIVLLCIAEPSQPLISILYEAVSAGATVGLSCSMTGAMGIPGRIIIIVTMFIGRVGPLTLALALSHRQTSGKDKLKYPEAHIMIG